MFSHFPETRVQRNVLYKLNGSNSKKPRGQHAKLIFSVETVNDNRVKNNPQVYTTQEGMGTIETTLRYTLPKRV